MKLSFGDHHLLSQAIGKLLTELATKRIMDEGTPEFVKVTQGLVDNGLSDLLGFGDAELAGSAYSGGRSAATRARCGGAGA